MRRRALWRVTAHGAAPEVYQRAQAQGLELINTTCPLVTRVQQLAKKLVQEGDWVVVYGDASHPELKGILGWANSVFDEPQDEGDEEKGKSKVKTWNARRAICAKSVEEIEAALAADGTPAAKIRKIAVISQTTQNTEWFKAFVRDVVSRFLEFGCEVHAHNTICLPTAKRQPAALELAKEVDVMVVVAVTNWPTRATFATSPPSSARLPRRAPRAVAGRVVQGRAEGGRDGRRFYSRLRYQGSHRRARGARRKDASSPAALTGQPRGDNLPAIRIQERARASFPNS